MMSDRMRFFVIPTVFMVGALTVLVSLGNWQLQRLDWKTELIANAQERPGLSPVPAPGPEDWPDFDFDEQDLRPVTVTGRFGPGEVHVYTVLTKPNGPEGGQGFWIMAPFVAADGWTVMVNRGFVPGAKKQPDARPGSEAPEGESRIVGLIRRAPKPNSFTPDNNIESNEWYLRDPVAIGLHLGVKATDLAPYSLDLRADETPSGGLPQAGETVVTFTNTHMQYAVTWYGLALTLIGVYLAFMWTRLRAARTADPQA